MNTSTQPTLVDSLKDLQKRNDWVKQHHKSIAINNIMVGEDVTLADVHRWLAQLIKENPTEQDSNSTSHRPNRY